MQSLKIQIVSIEMKINFLFHFTLFFSFFILVKIKFNMHVKDTKAYHKRWLMKS